MLEQQVRAEAEAAEWRRLRAEVAAQEAVQQELARRALEPPLHQGGSIILKALVRVAIGALGALVAYIASMTSGGGWLDAWFAVIGGFVVAMALTAFGPARDFVAMTAHAMRWMLIIGAVLTCVWLIVQMQA